MAVKIFSWINLKTFFKAGMTITIVLVVCIFLLIKFLSPNNQTAGTDQGEWVESKGFFLNGEYPSDKNEVRLRIKHIKGIKLVASWGGSDANTGVLISSAFKAPARIGMLVVGYPIHKGNQLYLEQINTKERISIASFNPGEMWREIAMSLPTHWYNTNIRVVACDQSRDVHSWLGLSSPYTLNQSNIILVGDRILSVQRMIDQITTLVKTIALYSLSMFFLLIPGFWIHAKYPDKIIYDDSLILLMSFAFIALFGYVTFWAFFINHLLGKCLTGVLMIGTFYVFLRKHSRLNIIRIVISSEVFWPLILTFSVGLFYILVLALEDGSPPFPCNAAVRFLHLPSDNILPFKFTERLFHGNDPRLIHGDWLSSDRPPLQTGIILSQRHLGSVFRDAMLHYQLSATILQCIWIPAVWGLCRKIGLFFSNIAIIFMFLIFSGFFLLNSVYVWPKLLSGAFVTGAFVLLFKQVKQERQFNERIFIAAILSGLGMLSHGGVIFTLLAITIFLLSPSMFPGLKQAMIGLVTFMIIMIPWVSYQKYYEPPGNRLVKWHIAGVIAIDSRSAWETIVDSYKNLSWNDFIKNRKANVGALWKGHFFSPIGLANGQKQNIEFRYLINALGVLNVGWFVWLFIYFRSIIGIRRQPQYIRTLKLIFHVSLTAVFIWVMLMYIPGSTIIHQGSYATMILIFCFLAIIVSSFPRFLLIFIIVLHITDFFCTWVYPKHPYFLNHLMLMMVIFFSISILYFLICLSKANPTFVSVKDAVPLNFIKTNAK